MWQVQRNGEDYMSVRRDEKFPAKLLLLLLPSLACRSVREANPAYNVSFRKRLLPCRAASESSELRAAYRLLGYQDGSNLPHRCSRPVQTSSGRTSGAIYLRSKRFRVENRFGRAWLFKTWKLASLTLQ